MHSFQENLYRLFQILSRFINEKKKRLRDVKSFDNSYTANMVGSKNHSQLFSHHILSIIPWNRWQFNEGHGEKNEHMIFKE